MFKKLEQKNEKVVQFMQETRSIRCRVSEEDNEVRLWQCFGWTLLSSQEVNITDNSFVYISDNPCQGSRQM